MTRYFVGVLLATTGLAALVDSRTWLGLFVAVAVLAKGAAMMVEQIIERRRPR